MVSSKRSIYLKTLEIGEEFEIPSLALKGKVLDQSLGSTRVIYYNYKPDEDSSPQRKILNIAPLTQVRKIK